MLADPILANLRTLTSAKSARINPRRWDTARKRDRRFFDYLGSLELLKLFTKLELGEMLATFATRDKATPLRDAATWALGRLASRVPLYGPLIRNRRPKRLKNG